MLQVHLLGQFDIRSDGKRVTIPSRAAQSLFAFLILSAGTLHRREKIAGIFWPETSDENARRYLRQELWRIRKALSAVAPDEYLVAEEFALTFDRESDYWLDVTHLEKPDSEVQALMSNLSLYRGELLPGFYDDWIALERERVQSVFESKMRQLLEQLVAAECWVTAQEWAEKWLAFGDAPEPAYRALMLAYGARGDMAQVASTYQRCTDDLREQLGVEPSAETRALYDGLFKGAQVPLRTATVQAAGTVTFLFTDIEGSTRLLDKLGKEYANVLADHAAILRAAFQKWNGREADTQGDAFFVSFARALDAVQCAVQVQRTLAAHAWAQGECVRVRMGLHTGEPLVALTGYVGMDMHRAARIGDAGHGGQVLISQTTRELVIHELPAGVTIRDLGEQRLKDLKYPTALYQLVIQGLQNEFPPLRTRFTGTETPTPGEPPFKGMQYFDEQDSNLFFGREALTQKLVRRLHDSHFLSAIIGASGSGKSSLVRAGLIPALRAKNDNVHIHVMTPTMHPLEALAILLTRANESVTATTTLLDDLTRDPRALYLYLARMTKLSPSSPIVRHVLVIDQFEELFTLCRDEFEREQFIDNLLYTLAQSLSFTLILTLRADFYAHLAHYPELRDLVAQQQEYIGPMTTEELRRAIAEPAKLRTAADGGAWEFEPGLVDLILRDVGAEPGALPLLSHALLETWKRRAGHTLTLKGYADAGGVHGAIAHTAESAYENLSPEQQTIARGIFLRLTELGQGTEDTRRRVSFDELLSQSKDSEKVRALLNLLADARLITVDNDTVQVAHEALIREWSRLREWLNQDREGLRLHRSLTEAAQEWELLERDPGALYRGARLAQAREWSLLNRQQTNELERTFLDASNEQAERETREREQAQQRELQAAQKLAQEQKARAEESTASAKRLRQFAYGLAGAFLLAMLLAGLALLFGDQARVSAVIADVNAKQAETERRIATARELAASAVSNLTIDPERSILLALQAVNKTYAIDHTTLPEAEDALHRAIQTSRVDLTLNGHSDVVWSAVFSPDGTKIATASADGTAKLWDAATGKELLSLIGSNHGIVWYATFSPDGRLLATAGADQSARIWNAMTGEELFKLVGHTDQVFHIEFSPDASRLATASPDGTVKIWDARTGKELLTLVQGDGAMPYWVTFSPDSSRIAVANTAGSIEGWASVWDAVTGEMLLTLPHQDAFVNSVSFSPDGAQFVTTSDDQTARIWDTTNGKELLRLYGQTVNVVNATYSPDGKSIATATGDRQVKIWDAITGQELLILPGHIKDIVTVAYSPDGTRIVSASKDGTAKVWNIAPHGELLTLVNGPAIASPVGAKLTYSPDGSRLAVAYSDPTAKVWDMTTGKLLLNLTGHTDAVNFIAYNADGTRLATAARDGTVKIWDAVSGKELLTLPVHQDFVIGVAFSPDGTRLATAAFDHYPKIWDAETGKLLLTIAPGHSDWLASAVFSPDGSRLATSGWDSTARVWDAVSGEELLTLNGHTDVVRQVIYSPDGTRLATAGLDGNAKVWDAASGKELLTLSGHSGSVFAVAFSADGKYLATASGDKTAKLWDAVTGKNFLTLNAPEALTGVAFHPDGTQLATASRDGANRIYLLRIQDLVTLAKQRVTRALTLEECQRYLHTETCPVEQ